MRPLKKLCKDFLYLLPRLLLFSVFLACFLITVFVTVDSTRPYLYPVEAFRQWAVRLMQG